MPHAVVILEGNPVLAQIAALAAQAPVNARRRQQEFQTENDMEAVCIALAKRHEADNPKMNGLVQLAERAILAERAKINEINERLNGIEKKTRKHGKKIKKLT